MSFSGRIRLYLVATALLPPMLMMLVVYFYSGRQIEITYQETAAEDLRKLSDYRDQLRTKLETSLDRVADHSWFDRSVRLSQRGQDNKISFDDLTGIGLDFYELVDQDHRVVASYRRPGLIGEMIDKSVGLLADQRAMFESTEFDVGGRHAALAGVGSLKKGFRIYGGYYLEKEFVPFASLIFHGQLSISFAEPDHPAGSQYDNMQIGSLYRHGDILQARLLGSGESGYSLVADFTRPERGAVFASFIDAVSLVALVSVLAAIGLGLFVSHRTRREFDNLIEAFDRVATGDLNTAVMAYTEGEFSHLADSFSQMTLQLRRSQQELAMSEKIAAWQMMARKIAHEIKNPLTPIGIGADDLRRSYQEKLPGFDQTLDQNTRMIRSEVNRLTRLLDEFVSFARMKPVEIRLIKANDLLSELTTLYAGEITGGRLEINEPTGNPDLKVDPELMRQLLVNLIKNSLEASDEGQVWLSLNVTGDELQIIVSDQGPGFSETILSHRFEPYLSSKKDGSGLGLVICQRIVFDHGGSIKLSNRTEGGAEVSIVLPQS